MKTRHALTALAAAAGLAVGMSMTPTALAASTSASERHWIQYMDNYIEYNYDHHCIGADPAGIAIMSCADSDEAAKDWDVTAVNGSFKFYSANAQKCLDGSARYGVRMYTCSDASYNNGYQKWVEYTYSSDGVWIDLKNVATGQCLDLSSAYGLRLHTCSTASFTNGYQKWVYGG
ncbi:RICIN domain-containing protein [Catenulispora acidiphila]|nr:RICIN domain-containing protein [Catenulispora acidiphila]